MTTENQAPDEWGDLANQLDEDYPRSWRPGKTPKGAPKDAKPDPLEIMGTVVRTDVQGVTWQGRTRNVHVAIIAKHPEGELRSVWMIHKTIAEDYARQGVKDGDRIAMRYLGWKDSKENPGQGYHAYRLAVRRASSGVAMPGAQPAVQPDFGDEPPE